MEIREQISRQRVRHIVDSYQLGDREADDFDDYLDDLLRVYPMPLVELALTETLVDHWLTVPMVKGFGFLVRVHQKLKAWESQSIVHTITPDQFQQITGLDPHPVFGVSECPPAQPTANPLG